MRDPPPSTTVISAGGAGNATPVVLSAGGAGGSKSTSFKKTKKNNAPPRTTSSSSNSCSESIGGSNNKSNDNDHSIDKKNNNNEDPIDGSTSCKTIATEPQHESQVLFEMIPLGEEEISAKDGEVPGDQQQQSLRSNEHSKSEQSLDDLTDTLMEESNKDGNASTKYHDLMWLFICFLGIMFSFVCYGLMLEYVTSGGRKLHELSFLFVTSLLYTLAGAAGRYVRDEKPTTMHPTRFAVLGILSMGSTFCSVRSLRYVIYPIQVLAKSCKPVPVMIIGAFLGKQYPLKKYLNVLAIIVGVALFMGGGDDDHSEKQLDDAVDAKQKIIGLLLLFTSLCFDGGTGAYEDKLMSVHHVGPFDLMYNIQMGKTILAGVGLVVMNEAHIFLQMVQEMGFMLVALGVSGAIGQAFIFITISKFGALTCSIIGLARKVTTLVASIYIYGHALNSTQSTGLVLCISAMIFNFLGKSGKNGHGGHGEAGGESNGEKREDDEETQPMLEDVENSKCDIELGTRA